MSAIKNPARSRPLSANVKRLMKMAREAPINPNVQKIDRGISARDLAYCDMQGNIFMAALDRGLTMTEFAPVYMNSQIAGVMDYSFSCVGDMENNETVKLLQVPLLLKSPEVIVDVVIWLNNVVGGLEPDESANLAIVKACLSEDEPPAPSSVFLPELAESDSIDIDALADDYEYAYWLGYIYRCECLMHDESSRMVYGAFNERFIKKTYDQMLESGIRDETLSACAGEICRRLDMMLVGKLWK